MFKSKGTGKLLEMTKKINFLEEYPITAEKEVGSAVGNALGIIRETLQFLEDQEQLGL